MPLSFSLYSWREWSTEKFSILWCSHSLWALGFEQRQFSLESMRLSTNKLTSSVSTGCHWPHQQTAQANSQRQANRQYITLYIKYTWCRYQISHRHAGKSLHSHSNGWKVNSGNDQGWKDLSLWVKENDPLFCQGWELVRTQEFLFYKTGLGAFPHI